MTKADLSEIDRSVFLKLALLLLGLALLGYVLLGTFDASTTGVAAMDVLIDGLYLGLTILIGMLVVAALFLLNCYRAPRLGAAIYHRAEYLVRFWTQPTKMMHVAPYREDRASDEKQMASARRQRRADRRRYARQTMVKKDDYRA